MPFFITLIFVGLSCIVHAQSGWKTLDIPPASRYDDVFFRNDSTGWAVSSSGNILRTDNGGQSWTLQASAGKYLRSVEFTTATTGFCGSLDTSFYKTTDGGQTWIDISPTISPAIPGICGLSAPDPMNIFGCGVWFSPAFIIKSADGGNTWSYIDLSGYARGLVDILFLNKDTGLVAGISNNVQEGGVILRTTDGGATWEVVHKTNIPNEYVWKLQTPDKVHFYAAVQNAPGAQLRMLRSPTEGKSWFTTIVKPHSGFIQMIGFLDKYVGWTGGEGLLFKTTDGGLTWSENITLGDTYNRFFRLNSKIAFLTGERIYKYNGLHDGDPTLPRYDEVHSLNVFPNPATTTVRIEAVFNNPTTARLEICGAQGNRVAELFSGRVQQDSRSFEQAVGHLQKGVYYVVLRTNEGLIARELIKS